MNNFTCFMDNTSESFNLFNRNYYKLRSRIITITTPKPYSIVRKSKKRTFDKNDDGTLDPDSGFVNDFDSPLRQERSLAATPILRVTINKTLNWKKTLSLVERSRDIGVYIECCNLNCKKFRYCEKYHDPVDVPELWFCHDLGVPGVTCATPECDTISSAQEELIENAYTAGSLVWARWPGFPWWPAMICDSPDTMTYYLLKPSSDIPFKYHAVYFTNSGNIKRSWLTLNNLRPFTKTSRETLNKRMIYRSRDFTDEVQAAYDMANAILQNNLTITERLARYSFLSFFGGYSPSAVASFKSLRSVNTIVSNLRAGSISPTVVRDSEDEIFGTPQKTPKYRKLFKGKYNKLFHELN